MNNNTRTPTIIGEYQKLQDAARDVLTACKSDEKHSQNSGLLRAECEILLAAHRCAAAIENSNRILAELCDHVQSYLTFLLKRRTH
jgi:hypothetical protein